MYEQTLEQFKGQRDDFAAGCPKLYRNYVRREMILTSKRQRELAKLSKEDFFDYIMNRNSMEHLEIFPENANGFMLFLADEVFKTLRSLNGKSFDGKSISKLRKRLGSRAKLTALSDWGDLYTQVPRERGDVMATGKLEYKVTKAIPFVICPLFFGTETLGYYGFFKFYEEHIGEIAPEGANSYLLGNTWCINVHNGRACSPIIAADYRYVRLKDDVYHIAPIKFFKAEFDKSKRYTTKTEVTARGANGDVAELITRVVERK